MSIYVKLFCFFPICKKAISKAFLIQLRIDFTCSLAEKSNIILIDGAFKECKHVWHKNYYHYEFFVPDYKNHLTRTVCNMTKT